MPRGSPRAPASHWTTRWTPMCAAQALSEGYLSWDGRVLVATAAGRLRLDALLAALLR